MGSHISPCVSCPFAPRISRPHLTTPYRGCWYYNASDSRRIPQCKRASHFPGIRRCERDPASPSKFPPSVFARSRTFRNTREKSTRGERVAYKITRENVQVFPYAMARPLIFLLIRQRRANLPSFFFRLFLFSFLVPLSKRHHHDDVDVDRWRGQNFVAREL